MIQILGKRIGVQWENVKLALIAGGALAFVTGTGYTVDSVIPLGARAAGFPAFIVWPTYGLMASMVMVSAIVIIYSIASSLLRVEEPANSGNESEEK